MAVIGLDAGTSTVKAVLFDDQWLVIATASRPAGVDRPRAGWAEQDPAQVWQSVKAVVGETVEAAMVAGLSVDLVAVTAQGDGCWLVDQAGNPVRPAMLWNDARASDIVDAWDRDGLLQLAFERTGSWGFAGLAHAQLAWLHEFEPETLQAARRLLSCGSYLYAQFTGRQVLDVSEASNPFLRADGAGYDHDLLDRLGIGFAYDLLPDVVAAGTRAAPLLPDVAHALGLLPGTPCVLAPYDVVTTAVGLGAVSPTSAMAILGTTLAVGVISPDAALHRPATGSALDLGLDGLWMLLYATLAGTEVLEWGRRLLALPDVESLMQLAGTASTSRPPLTLPYLSPAGERTPFRDASARGALLGLHLEHTPADVALGLVQGLSLVVAECLRASGRTPERLSVAGGGARSDLWCQTLSDACDVMVERGSTDQGGALGAALVGVSELNNTPLDIGAGITTGTTFEPHSVGRQRMQEEAARLLAARANGAHHF